MAAGQSEPLKVQLRSIGKIDTFLETNMAVYSFIRAALPAPLDEKLISW